MEISSLNNAPRFCANAQREEKTKKNIGGSVLACCASEVAALSSLPFSLAIVSKMGKNSREISKDSVSIVNKAVDEVLNKTTNLSKKGVKIIDFSKCKPTNGNSLLDKILEIQGDVNGVIKGKNALFLDKDVSSFTANSILINREKLSLATFHELGHAYNFNNSKFWKTMQNLRMPGLKILSALALFNAFTKESKPEENKELSTSQKVKNNIRKFSPLIALLSGAPMLLEEGKATLRGNEWAKKLLNKDLAKKVSKTNGIAYFSYVSAVAAGVLSVFVSKKIKDVSQEKKEAKELSNKV